MKKYCFSQDELVILSSRILAEKLVLYAATGMKIAEVNNKISEDDENFIITNMLKEKGYISFENGYSYSCSDEIKALRDVTEDTDVKIEILKNEGKVNKAIETLLLNAQGCLSLKLNEETKIFDLEFYGEDEFIEFLSNKLGIPTSYKPAKEESYIAITKTKYLSGLLDAYTEKNDKKFKKYAHKMKLSDTICYDLLDSTWNNEDKKEILVFTRCKNNIINSVTIYKYDNNFYIFKSCDNIDIIAHHNFSQMLNVILTY